MRTLPLLAIAVVAFAFMPQADAAPRGKKAAAAKAAPKAPNVKLKPVDDQAEAPASAPAVSSRGPTRIDFDDRLIQGQTNKSGAVYLYDRKELKTRSMIKKRESFRDEIVSSIYD
ncbi:MAG: hypothetical protein ACYC8T_35545 [Myxococcaceae bacterium]